MRKLLIVSALTILSASGLGCTGCSNCLCGGGRTMYARRAPTQCCDPCCCSSGMTGVVTPGPVMTAEPMMSGMPVMTGGPVMTGPVMTAPAQPCCQ